MARRSTYRRHHVARRLLLVVAVLSLGFGYLVAGASTTSTTSTTVGSRSASPARELHQLGWTIASSTGRGVMVDFRNIKIGRAMFRAVRLRARTTLLRWHVGRGDPNAWARAPLDAGPAIDWTSEGPAGVVAVFNGGFKQSAAAGGAVVDAVTLNPLVRGDMTIVLNRLGHWEMGTWGARGFPTVGFNPIAYRQNLTPLVVNGALTSAATSTNWQIWGSPLNNNPFQARTGLGVDANGNLIYVATMYPVLDRQVGEALIAAGAVTAMELDINPYWPILGVSRQPLHAPGGVYGVLLAGQMHSPSVYDTGWQRDFFVALAEPSNWNCNWSSPGLSGKVKGPQPQPLSLVGAGCATKKASSPTS